MAGTADDAEEVTLDRLSGEWWIYQLRRGHRYATDDVLVAWLAFAERPGARRLLDLGSGVGSVGLMALRLMSDTARLVAVEVQAASVELARRTVAHNDVADRVDLRLGDLRDPALLAADELFDVITANPPFLPPGSGWTSPHPQRSAARFELHGDIHDYCRTAARHLAPAGRFCFCHAAADPRPEAAATGAGLAVLSRRPVTFGAGRPPRIALYVCGHAGAGACRELEELCIRDAGGQRTAAYMQVLRDVGIAA